jgi:hypothetical protein
MSGLRPATPRYLTIGPGVALRREKSISGISPYNVA